MARSCRASDFRRLSATVIELSHGGFGCHGETATAAHSVSLYRRVNLLSLCLSVSVSLFLSLCLSLSVSLSLSSVSPLSLCLSASLSHTHALSLSLFRRLLANHTIQVDRLSQKRNEIMKKKPSILLTKPQVEIRHTTKNLFEITCQNESKVAEINE